MKPWIMAAWMAFAGVLLGYAVATIAVVINKHPSACAADIGEVAYWVEGPPGTYSCAHVGPPQRRKP